MTFFEWLLSLFAKKDTPQKKPVQIIEKPKEEPKAPEEPPKKDFTDAQMKFLNALMMQESSLKPGFTPPSKPILGDHGLARGPLQIHRIYWEDVKHVVGGVYEDVDKEDYAKQCVKAYMKRYSKGNWDRIGETNELQAEEYCARLHNGGPNGNRIVGTLIYWQGVKRFLKG